MPDSIPTFVFYLPTIVFVIAAFMALRKAKRNWYLFIMYAGLASLYLVIAMFLMSA